MQMIFKITLLFLVFKYLLNFQITHFIVETHQDLKNGAGNVLLGLLHLSNRFILTVILSLLN